MGSYGKLGFISAKNRSTDVKISATRAALGILFGNKWVTDGGFVFELNAGVGRATILGSSEDADFEAASTASLRSTCGWGSLPATGSRLIAHHRRFEHLFDLFHVVPFLFARGENESVEEDQFAGVFVVD